MRTPAVTYAPNSALDLVEDVVHRVQTALSARYPLLPAGDWLWGGETSLARGIKIKFSAIHLGQDYGAWRGSRWDTNDRGQPVMVYEVDHLRFRVRVGTRIIDVSSWDVGQHWRLDLVERRAAGGWRPHKAGARARQSVNVEGFDNMAWSLFLLIDKAGRLQ